MKFDIITIFPKIFDSYLNESIIKRAQKKKLIKIRIHNARVFAKDKHKTADNKPYGGGAGMVMRAEPVLRAVSALKLKVKSSKFKTIVLSAKGKQFSQKMAQKWAKLDQLVLISGRYEGIDERVKIALKAEEISIGPYVLTDGDAASQVIISVVTRLIPGVIKKESLDEESFGNSAQQVEYPHYTRPEVLTYKGKKYRVPKVLLSGNHKKIEEWRKKHRKRTCQTPGV